MVGIDVFIPEVPGDLKDPFEPSDNKAFEIELRCDSQEKLLTETVMECGEWPGICTAVYWLKNGCFELKEIPFREVPSDRRENLASFPESLTGVFIYYQVDIPLPVPFFHIGEPVEFLGERTDGF